MFVLGEHIILLYLGTFSFVFSLDIHITENK